MKQKDIVYAVLAAIIFVAVGVLIMTQVMPKKSAGASVNEVEVAYSFSSNLDDKALTQLTDVTQVTDFGITFDLTAGLGNPAFFGK